MAHGMSRPYFSSYLTQTQVQDSNQDSNQDSQPRDSTEATSSCPLCSHPIRGLAAHAPRSLMSYTLTFERFLGRLFSPRFTIMNGGGIEFMTDGILGAWLEGGNEATKSDLMSSIATHSSIPPPASPTAYSVTNLEDNRFGDITSDLVLELSNNNDKVSHPQTPTNSTASFGLENGFDMEGFDNGFLDSNNLYLDDDMFDTDYIGTMDISAFSDFVVSPQPICGSGSPLSETSGNDYNTTSFDNNKSLQESTHPVNELGIMGGTDGYQSYENSIIPTNVPVSRPARTRLVCGINGCRRSYKRQFELNRHQQVHSGVRSHACTIIGCNRSGSNGFTRRDHLRQHERQVHGF